jgi:hypothetical protein
MSIWNASFLLRAALSAAGGGLLGGCDQWALFVSSDGVLAITIVSDGYTIGRFRIQSRELNGVSRVTDVPPSGQLTLSGLKPGEVEVTLLAPPQCQVAAPNPQTLIAEGDGTISVNFSVHCGSTPGQLGKGPEAAGWQARIGVGDLPQASA